MNILSFNFQSFGNMLKSLWNGLCNVLAPVFEGVFQHISDIFTFVTDSILSVLDVFIGLFSGNWEQCWDGSKGIFTAIWDFVVNQFSNILNVLRDVADVFLGWFGTSWNEVWMSIWNNVKSSISSVISGIYNTIKGGFDNAVNYVKGLASDSWNWGRDIVSNIIDGLRSMIGSLADSVSGIADTIHSYLHFSVPDVGPLTDFESWMPDFMSGLAEGIEKSRGMVKAAVNSVAADMVVSPQMAVADGGVMTGTGPSGGADLTAGIVAALKDVLGDQKGQQGDLVIPVYLGNQLLDEVIVTAQQRMSLRSGGR